jgi:hypothetical protein
MCTKNLAFLCRLRLPESTFSFLTNGHCEFLVNDKAEFAELIDGGGPCCLLMTSNASGPSSYITSHASRSASGGPPRVVLCGDGCHHPAWRHRVHRNMQREEDRAARARDVCAAAVAVDVHRRSAGARCGVDSAVGAADAEAHGSAGARHPRPRRGNGVPEAARQRRPRAATSVGKASAALSNRNA